MVWIQNQLVGSAIGQKISLECQSEAYPKSINYWMKNDTIITQGKNIIRNKTKIITLTLNNSNFNQPISKIKESPFNLSPYHYLSITSI